MNQELQDGVRSALTNGGEKVRRLLWDGLVAVKAAGGEAAKLAASFEVSLSVSLQLLAKGEITQEAAQVSTDRTLGAFAELEEGIKEAAAKAAIARGRKAIEIATDVLLALASVGGKALLAGL